MYNEFLLLGVDGGGARCRACHARFSGETLGEGASGPAKIRFGLEDSFAAVLDATAQCLGKARLAFGDQNIIACLALAGASEPAALAAFQDHEHPFRQAIFITDAHAACVAGA